MVKIAVGAGFLLFGFLFEAVVGQRCGKDFPGNTCPVTEPCCSQYGWCGKKAAHCGAGCQFGCTVTTPKPTPGPTSGGGPSGTAAFTWYESYAPCCYDSNADQTECTLYNACKWAGQFAALSGTKSLAWVKSHDLVSFYDNNHPGDAYFQTHYGNRYVRVTKGAVSFVALAADTCGNIDCNGCCRKNCNAAGTRYLVDMEYWTVMRHFNGDINAADGTLQFQFL
ncbi:unnamed protein product [Phaeothamnion confervicola]